MDLPRVPESLLSGVDGQTSVNDDVKVRGTKDLSTTNGQDRMRLDSSDSEGCANADNISKPRKPQYDDPDAPFF